MDQASPVSLDFDKSLVFRLLFRGKGWHAPRYQRSTRGVYLRAKFFQESYRRNSGRIVSGEIPGMRITMKRQKYAPIVTWFTATALLVSVCAGLVFNQPTAAQSNEPSQSASQRDARSQASDYPALAKYTTDLTQLALRGKPEPAHGRDADITRVIESLERASKSPVVVGEFDLDRNAIARGLAFRIAFGEDLAKRNSVNYISPDVKLESFGHDADNDEE
jgi:hypothetical protein